MFSKWFVAGLMIFTLSAGGCETTKGFAKDVKSAWSGAQEIDGWFKENLW